VKKIFIFLIILNCFLISSIFAEEVIDINTASLQQLDILAGIGPVYAQRIVDGRPYSSVDDLDRVKGIGLATIQKIKEQGLACVNCSTSNVKQSLNETKQIELGALTTSIIYVDGVYINEVLPNPEGADETDEWIVSTIQQIASVCS